MKNIPAFPVFPDTSHGHASAHQGMTLRDYFAAKALPSVINDWLNSGDIFADHEIPEVIARDCYIVADAMLKARNV